MISRSLRSYCLRYRFFNFVLHVVIFTVQRVHKAIESVSDLITELLVSKKFPLEVVDLVGKFFRPDYQPLILQLFSKNAADSISIPDYKVSNPIEALTMTRPKPRFVVDWHEFEKTMGFPTEEVLQHVTGDFRRPQNVMVVPQQNDDMVMVMPRQPII